MASNVIDFMSATAKFMAKDRPDLYQSNEEALDEISRVMDSMRDDENRVALFSSYAMFWLPDADGDEWILTRKIATVLTDNDGTAIAYGWTNGSGTLKYGVELPDVDDDMSL